MSGPPQPPAPPSAPPPAASRVCVVVGPSAIAGEVAAALAEQGHRVVTADVPAEPAPGAFPDVAGAVDTALRAGGLDPADGADLVVHAHVEPDALVARPIADLAPAEWDRLAEAPVRAGIASLQAAHPLLTARRGRFVMVAPTVGMEGADGLVAAATAAEALRALGKSAARRWAAAGVTVNLVAPTVIAMHPVAAALRGTDADRGEGVVLGEESKTARAAAEVVLTLLTPGARHLTGATLTVDAGGLMSP